MKETGTANIMLLSFIGTLMALFTPHSHLIFADLKTSDSDGRTLYALSVCFGFGCGAQLVYLLARVGRETVHPWQRWIGEILLGGAAAYIACELWVWKGPDVTLPLLIVGAIFAGFAGQRFLVFLLELFFEWSRKKVGLSGTKPGGGDDAG